MKIDRTKHKPSWRVQKGCKVEWFEPHRKGCGVVTKVISGDITMWGNDPKFVVIDDVALGNVTVDVSNIRILKGKKDEN
jgi:hypothetical protein